MAKIRNEDVSEKDVFLNIRTSAENTIKVLGEMSGILKANLEQQKLFVSGLKSNQVADLKKLSEAQKEVKKNVEGLNAVEKEQVRLKEKLTLLDTKEASANAELKRRITEKTKALKDDAAATDRNANAYKKLTHATNQAQSEFKRLAAEFGVNSRQAKSARIEFDKLDNKLRLVNDAARDGRRDVGRYGLAWGGISKVFGALGITAGIAGFVNAIKGVINTNRDFEKSLSSLSSLTGATGKDLKFYKEQAKQIGATTTLSSTQAVDAFKMIGSQRPELLKNAQALAEVTRQAVILAEASGLELPEAATALTTSLNQMNVSANQSARFINVLAAGSKEGAADIPYLNAAIEKSGAVARDANLSFEELVAAIETIAPSIAEPSSAGLKLSNVLLRLQEDGKGFQSGKFNLKDALNQVKKEFDGMTDPVKRVQAETKLFGKESIIAGKALLNNIDVYGNFTKVITDTTVALDQQSTNIDNLDGDLKNFDSTLEAVSLQLSGEGGLFRAFVQVSTELLKLIFGLNSADEKLTDTQKSIKSTAKTVFVLLKAITILSVTYLAYSLAVKASNAYTAISTTVTSLFTRAKIIETAAVNGATAATQAFNVAQKANPLGLVIALLAAAVTAYIVFNDSVSEAVRLQDLLNDAQRTGAESEQKNIALKNESLNKKIEEINLQTKINISNATNEKERTTAELKGIDDVLKAKQKAVLILKAEFETVLSQAKILKEEREIEKKDLNIEIEKRAKLFLKADTKRIQDKKTNIEKLVIREAEKLASAKELKLQLDILANDVLISEADEKINAKEKGSESIKAVEDRSKELALLEKRLRDSRINLLNDELNQSILRIQNKFSDQIEVIKGNSKTEIALRKSLELEMLQEIDEVREKHRLKASKDTLELMTVTDDVDSQDEAQKGLDKIKEKEDAENQLRIDLREKTLSIIDTLEQAYFDKRLTAADKEISDQEAREQQLQDLANRGIQDAKDSLAKNQKDQVEAEKKKEELIQQQKQFQLALALFKAFNAELEANPQAGSETALVKALTSTSLLTAAAAALPAFFDGSEDVGSGGSVDNKGGFNAILHPHERVVDKNTNDKLKGITNNDLGKLADNGMLAYALNSNQMGVAYSNESPIKMELTRLYESNERIIKAIENRPVDKGWEVDELRKLVKHTTTKGNSINKTTFKL